MCVIGSENKIVRNKALDLNLLPKWHRCTLQRREVQVRAWPYSNVVLLSSDTLLEFFLCCFCFVLVFFNETSIKIIW